MNNSQGVGCLLLLIPEKNEENNTKVSSSDSIDTAFTPVHENVKHKIASNNNDSKHLCLLDNVFFAKVSLP